MFNLFGINISDLSVSEALGRVDSFVKINKPHIVVTANPEIFLEARLNPDYLAVLCKADLVLADGIGLVIASYLYGKPIRNGRVVGVDFVEQIIKESGQRGYSVFLAGSTQHILNKTTLNLQLKYKNINIVGNFGAENCLPTTKDEFEIFSNNLILKLKEIKPDILLLALGHPLQEFWLYQNLKQTPVKVGIGVGGTFDFLSGQIKRAPAIIRCIGLEWFWRLLIQPWRIKRIIRAVIIFPMVIIYDLIKNVLHGTKSNN